jgi:hypothetical protein
MNHETPRNETKLKGIPKKIGKWALAAAVTVGIGAGIGELDNHSGYDKSSYRPSTATKTVETTTSMDTQGAPAFTVPEGNTLTPTESTTQTVTETQPNQTNGPNKGGGDSEPMNSVEPLNPGSTN